MVADPRVIVMLSWVPRTSFKSSSVCRPLKRAKSTVGVPLINETGVPPREGTASMPLICVAKDTMLAMGASVPITDAGAVTVAGVVGAAVEPEPPLQPTTSDAAAASETNESTKAFKCVLESIKNQTVFLFVSFRIFWLRTMVGQQLGFSVPELYLSCEWCRFHASV